MRGGIYTLPADPKSGKFTIEFRLEGTPEKPIIVRQMPGERATIDGALTLAGSDTWGVLGLEALAILHVQKETIA